MLDYETLRRLFLRHEYRPNDGGYACGCGWEGSSISEHLADVTTSPDSETYYVCARDCDTCDICPSLRLGLDNHPHRA